MKPIIEFDEQGRMLSIDVPAMRELAEEYYNGNHDDVRFMAAACIDMLDNFIVTYSAEGMVI